MPSVATLLAPQVLYEVQEVLVEVELVAVTPASVASLDDAFRDHQQWLVQRLALVVGDAEEARDIAQQTFVRAAEKWPFPPEQDVPRWLAVVGLRLALNERRRRRLWGFLEVRETDATWAVDANPDLWRALMSLDPRARAALVLTVLDGYTQDEVAGVLGVARGTVASWISRSRDRLRPILEERVP
jgi:RNA polymerase sigma factor (sigma-70 family)